MLRTAGSWLRTVVLALALFSALAANADTLYHTLQITDPIARGTFERLREPSGVSALDANTLMVVEDEATTPLTRLSLTAVTPADFSFEEFEQPSARSFIQRRLLGPLDDLEGIARLSDKRFFIIGSHENASRGRFPAREKLVLLTRDGNDISNVLMRTDLFDDLKLQYPTLYEKVDGSKKGDKSALNIEGLAYDRKRQRLLIGLRTPQINDDAIIITLTNPAAYLQGEQPAFDESLGAVDLNKGGIRAMSYDDESDQLLLISKRESGGSNRSTLWSLARDSSASPIRFRTDSKNLFRDVEGLTPIPGGFLFVRDNGGDNKKDDDTWFVLTRSQLGLAP